MNEYLNSTDLRCVNILAGSLICYNPYLSSWSAIKEWSAFGNNLPSWFIVVLNSSSNFNEGFF